MNGKNLSSSQNQVAFRLVIVFLKCLKLLYNVTAGKQGLASGLALVGMVPLQDGLWFPQLEGDRDHAIPT